VILSKTTIPNILQICHTVDRSLCPGFKLCHGHFLGFQEVGLKRSGCTEVLQSVSIVSCCWAHTCVVIVLKIYMADLCRAVADALKSIWLLEVCVQARSARNSTVSRNVLHPKIQRTGKQAVSP